VTGGAPGYFIRHFSIAALLRVAESLRASGREWPENATYNGGFFDKAMALCESMSKPVIAAISGTCVAIDEIFTEVFHFHEYNKLHPKSGLDFV
jgi:enoyl-CoA hydratase/carnithine racemase